MLSANYKIHLFSFSDQFMKSLTNMPFLSLFNCWLTNKTIYPLPLYRHMLPSREFTKSEEGHIVRESQVNLCCWHSMTMMMMMMMNTLHILFVGQC